MSEWQPIDTCPKDGSLFLCWVCAFKYTETDQGRDDHDVSEVDFCTWQTNDVCPDGWADNCMGRIGDDQWISHWMPLPPPPKEPEPTPDTLPSKSEH